MQAGALSATIDDGALRHLALHGVELVRRVDFTVRDQTWGTHIPQVIEERLDASHDHFRFERRFLVGDGALSCRVGFEGHADGRVTVVGEATARRSFVTPRAGLTVLHPLVGVVGRPVGVTTADGRRADVTMPDLISPSQPVTNIAGLDFEIEGLAVSISFSGAVFEMEDHRNWSDASFKTYCPPLQGSGSYEIPGGATVRQEIEIRVGGERRVPASPTVRPSAVTIGAPIDERLPHLLLAADDGWLPNGEQAARLASFGLRSTLLRVTTSNAIELLADAREALDAFGGRLDLEIVLVDGPAAPQVAFVADACRRAGVTPRRVVAQPLPALRRSGPGDPSPSDAYEAARHGFPEAAIGAGSLTNFTELNRYRPEGFVADYVTHGSAAISHAADDASVNQTLEGLREIYRSARPIVGDRPYRLGLTAIAQRPNPYGASPGPNPEQRRMTMTDWDPRARSLFGAAWAVGALAATEGFGIEAVALAAAVGPFGLLSSRSPIARPWYDDHPAAEVFPIFHVIAALAPGGERRRVHGVPDGLSAVAVDQGGSPRLVVANTSGSARELVLAEPCRGGVLDPTSFVAAVSDGGWLGRRLAERSPSSLTLEPAAVLFVEFDDPPVGR